LKKVVDNSKVVEKNKEYQLQSNDISNAIYSCSVTARRLIAFCISNAYNDHLELDMISEKEKIGTIKMPCMKSVFSYKDFFNRMDMKSDTRQIEQVKKAVDECMEAVIRIESVEHYKKYTWFISSDINKETGKIEMIFNPLIYQAITEWYFSTRGYSALSLELLGKLSSIYSMRYYEMALSQMGNKGKNGNESGQWFFERTVDELKTLFVLQGKYENRLDNFITKVIENPISELNTYNKDFQIEVIKIKEGRKTVGFRFICADKNKKLWKIAKTDSYEDKQIKIESNNLEKDINFYKTKFKRLWKEKSEEVKLMNSLPFDFEMNDEIETLKLVKKELEERKNPSSK
jgi:hypothetical protein